jgi:VanZ family protein
MQGEMTFRKFVRLWLPVLLWMGVIFLGSSIGNVPKAGGVAVDAIVHRTGHVIEFAILGWLLLRAVGDGRRITRREMAITLIVIALYGASDEFHQRFTPGRSSELSAVLFDTAGGLIGAWLWRWKSRKSTSQRISERPAQPGD